MLAVPVGLLASAILVVNNVRDLETDRRAGKRTLAVRLGRERARGLYAAMIYGAFLCAPLPWLLGSGELSAWLALPLLALPLAVPIVRTVRSRTDGPGAQRRARADRAAPARVLRAPVGGDPGELMATLEIETVRLPLRDPFVAAWGSISERELRARAGRLRRRGLRRGRGGGARALRRGLAGGGDGRARRLRARARAGRPAVDARRAARRMRGRAAAAAGARGDRPRALGPRRAAHGLPGREADRGQRDRGGRGQRGDRRRGPRGRGGRRGGRGRRRASAA